MFARSFSKTKLYISITRENYLKIVIARIKEAFKKMREQKEQEQVDEQKLDSYRQSEEMKKAEQVKKEADRLAHLKQYKHAIDEYSKALEIFPYDQKELMFKKPAEFFFKIYYNITASYSHMNRIKDSIEFFDKALGIDNVDNENKIKALMGKGNSHYMAKQLIKGGEETYKSRMDSDFDVDEKILESLKKLDEKN